MIIKVFSVICENLFVAVPRISFPAALPPHTRRRSAPSAPCRPRRGIPRPFRHVCLASRRHFGYNIAIELRGELPVQFEWDEDKAAPLSDQRIAHLFAESGVKLARRTVAKYRDELRIPVASARKV